MNFHFLKKIFHSKSKIPVSYRNCGYCYWNIDGSDRCVQGHVRMVSGYGGIFGSTIVWAIPNCHAWKGSPDFMKSYLRE